VPAAAVIQAPIAYIKVVAVKKLVVGVQSELSRSASWVRTGRLSLVCGSRPELTLRDVEFTSFTLKKLECSKQAFA